jgi:hypothetical protein
MVSQAKRLQFELSGLKTSHVKEGHRFYVLGHLQLKVCNFLMSDKYSGIWQNIIEETGCWEKGLGGTVCQQCFPKCIFLCNYVLKT